MFYDILDHVVIDQPFLVLKSIHKSLFADPVDHTGNSGRCFMDLIQCLGCKYFPGTPGVIHMACDILFRFGSVQMGQDTVHIDTLANSRISLQFQFVVPELSLTDQHDSHHLNVYKYIRYLLDQRPNDQMEDAQLEAMMPWNENVIKLCKLDN